MPINNFIEVRDYYYIISKVRLGEVIYNEILNDLSTSEIFNSLKNNYKLSSEFPNHIHIMSMMDRFRNKSYDNIIENYKLLLRAILLLSKFQEELNADFKIKSELEMIDILKKIVNEYEFLYIHKIESHKNINM